MEIGGGINLTAAQELLRQFGNLFLTEVETRRTGESVKNTLTETKRFFFLPGGFSAVIRDLEREKFDIVFFHNVLPHLPNPFLILEKSFNLLNNEGLLFANGVLIYEEGWKKK